MGVGGNGLDFLSLVSIFSFSNDLLLSLCRLLSSQRFQFVPLPAVSISFNLQCVGDSVC